MTLVIFTNEGRTLPARDDRQRRHGRIHAVRSPRGGRHRARRQGDGTPYRRLTSGAGHDAQYMAAMGPAGMVFVPSRNGRSHCEE